MDPTGLLSRSPVRKGQREACLGLSGCSEAKLEERGEDFMEGMENWVSLCHFPGLSCLRPHVRPILTLAVLKVTPGHQAEE